MTSKTNNYTADPNGSYDQLDQNVPQRTEVAKVAGSSPALHITDKGAHHLCNARCLDQTIESLLQQMHQHFLERKSK